MEIKCPRCGGPVTGGKMGFPATAMENAARVAGHECRKCGSIDTAEFPPEVRRRLRMKTLRDLAIVLAIFFAAIVLFFWLFAPKR